METKLLSIYLNDHLAGATAGAALARRAAGSNRGDRTYQSALETLAQEIAKDRASLLAIMGELNIATDHVKQTLACAVERAGRLKLNGRLLGYSPLSRLEELELLALAVTGKQALWRTLHLLVPWEPRLAREQIEELSTRAENQLQEIESCRRRAAGDAFVQAERQ